MKVIGYYKVFVGGEEYIAVSYSVYRELNVEPTECVSCGPMVVVPKKYLAQYEVQHSGLVRILD